MEAKTNEITQVEPLFKDLDITGAAVTADALLTQKAIARHVVEDKGADYVFTVKDNQPTLRQDKATGSGEWRNCEVGLPNDRRL